MNKIKEQVEAVGNVSANVVGSSPGVSIDKSSDFYAPGDARVPTFLGFVRCRGKIKRKRKK